MVDRIRLILQARGLSPTQFADVVGVARPVISHVLSGRNKPSLEVVQKILSAFPDLSMAWLLNGTGSMLAGLPATAIPEAPATPPAPVASSSVPSSSPNPGNAQQLPITATGNAESTTRAAVSPQAGALNTVQVPPVAAPQVGRPPTSTPRKFVPSATPAMARFVAPPRQIASAPNPPQPLAAVEPAPLPSAPTEHPVAAPPVTPSTAPSLDAALAFAEPGKAIRRIVIFYRDGSFADYQPE